MQAKFYCWIRRSFLWIKLFSKFFSLQNLWYRLSYDYTEFCDSYLEKILRLKNIEVNNFARYSSFGERALPDICSLPSQLNLLTTFTPPCAPSKFFNSRTQALKLYLVTSSAHTLVASCLFLGGEVWITVKNTKGELTSDENCRIRALHIISIGSRGKIIKIAFVGGMSVLKLTFHQQTNCLFVFWSILQP